jgi:hypothetical protein
MINSTKKYEAKLQVQKDAQKNFCTKKLFKTRW